MYEFSSQIDTNYSFDEFAVGGVGNHAVDPSHQTLNLLAVIRFYLQGRLVYIVCSLGIVGNFLSLLVLMSRYRRPGLINSDMYLCALNVSDIFSVFFTLFINLKYTEYPSADLFERLTGNAPLIHAYPVCHALTIQFQITSAWLTLMFSADRFIMICYPFRAQRVCTRRNCKIVILFTFVLAAVYNLPRFFEFEIRSVHITLPVIHNNQTLSILRTKLSPTAYTERTLFKIYYNSQFVFRSILPLIAIGVMNTALLIVVHRSIRQTRELNQMVGYCTPVAAAAPSIPDNNATNPTPTLIAIRLTPCAPDQVQSREQQQIQTKNQSLIQTQPQDKTLPSSSLISTSIHKVNSSQTKTIRNRNNKRRKNLQTSSSSNDTTVMLIGVVMIFLICQIPAGFHLIAIAFELFYETQLNWSIFVEISNFLIVLNSAINIVVFYAFSVKFRADLKKLLHIQKWCGNEQGSTVSTSHSRQFQNAMNRSHLSQV